MEKIHLTIDGKQIEVKPNTTILQAARDNGIDIPTLCFLKDVNNAGDCRMCIVEVEGRRGYTTACITACEEGMQVTTKSKELTNAKKVILELIISNHCQDCLTCIRNGNCELQTLAKKFGIDKVRFDGEKTKHSYDDKSVSIVRDMDKCILCKRCIGACNNVQQIGAIDVVGRGFDSKVTTFSDMPLSDVNCVNCGQCIKACPVGALYEKDNTKEVYEKLEDENTIVIFQTAPAVRAALGEEFSMPIGTNVTGKMVNAISMLGANYVFDTNSGADFTIVEEATEFVQRFLDGKKLPMFTSCCPAWVKYFEQNYPEYLEHLSSCKSPHQMFGSVLKNYYKQILGEDKEIYVVSVMPCVAKKYESKREQMLNDVDCVITTRELAKMIKQNNIDFANIEDKDFDSPFFEATGAAAIFGVTGGVMEAALRYAQEIITRQKSENIIFREVRGNKGIKEAVLNIDDQEIKIAVASGLSNAKKIMEKLKNGTLEYDFIEIMACPGGCIMGGGQPIAHSKTYLDTDIAKKRANVLYLIDDNSKYRKSQDNPYVQAIYDNFLEKHGSYKAKQVLHTSYSKKNKYNF